MTDRTTNLIKILAGFSVVSVAIGMSSCGRDATTRQIDSGTPVQSPSPNQSSTANPESTPSGTAAPSDSDRAGNSGSGVPSLFSQIRSNMHADTNESDKARLLTEEAQRCRGTGASVVDSDSGIVVPEPKELIRAYEAKHQWPGLDQCRRQLWLITSIGPQMRRENLIKLENCSRTLTIEKQSDLAERDGQRELLMAENLTLLCRMGNDELTPAVQEAISLGFISAWSNLGN
jgi:hypothetical protein